MSVVDEDAERGLIPVSALNHYVYCTRRCYLIHAENEFQDNVHTLRGTHEHERVDQQRHQASEGVRVEYGLPVWSQRLGLSGRCDAVEFRPDGTAYPVEYKHGKRQQWINDDLQLAAQAMCLEEMTGKPVRLGAIYHHSSRRRREVEITDTLRQQVAETVVAVRALLRSKALPPPVNDHRCPQCSLIEICQPEAMSATGKLHRLRDKLFDPDASP